MFCEFYGFLGKILKAKFQTYLDIVSPGSSNPQSNPKPGSDKPEKSRTKFSLRFFYFFYVKFFTFIFGENEIGKLW